MSRDWFAVYTSIILKPKYKRLNPATRGALFHIWALAGFQDPEAMWPDRRDLESTLDLDGWDGGAAHLGTPDGKAVINELIEWRWIDVDDEGRVWVHDWDLHQLAVTEKVRTAYERERKQDYRWRKRQSETPLPKNPLPGREKKEKDKTVSRDVRDTSGTKKKSNCGRCGGPLGEDFRRVHLDGRFQSLCVDCVDDRPSLKVAG